MQTACEAGYYCPGNGQRYQCPAGKYGSNSQSWQNSQCEGDCAAGFNCPPGSTNKFQQACPPSPTSSGGNADVARSWYCAAGQNQKQINTATEYTTSETGRDDFRKGKATCTVDEFCTNGKRTRRIVWGVAASPLVGDWSSCSPDAGGAATFTFAEGNDMNGDGTTGDFTEITFAATTPATGSVVPSLITSSGDDTCRQSWTNSGGNSQFNFFSGGKLKLTVAAQTPGLNFEDCRPPSGYSLLVRATVGGYSEDCKVTVIIGDVSLVYYCSLLLGVFFFFFSFFFFFFV